MPTLVNLKDKISSVRSVYWYTLIIVLGFALRIHNIQSPTRFKMDEAYYVRDAFSLLSFGYEKRWQMPEGKNSLIELAQLFVAGEHEFVSDDYLSTHPPLGKWLIAIGLKIFGYESTLGWRFTAVLFGTALIGLIMLLAHLIFKNNYITLLSGVLAAVEPVMITMSKTAHLDIFLTFFIVAALAALVKYLESRSWVWLSLSSALFALATSVKISSLTVLLAAFILLLVIDSVRVYKSDYKIKDSLMNAIRYIYNIAIFVVVYSTTWIGLYLNYLIPVKGLSFTESIGYIADYHVKMNSNAANITSPHPYRSNALEWLYAARPTALATETGETYKAVTATMPNLLLWMMGLVALIVLIAYIFKKKESISALVVPVLFLGAWLPWLIIGFERTIFHFYVVLLMPAIVIAAAWIIYQVKDRYVYSFKTSSALIFLIVAFSLFLYPVTSHLKIDKELHYSYKFYSNWLDMMQSSGLYDLSQLPEEVRNEATK